MKLDYRRTFLVGLAFFAICAFWQLYDLVVPLMLKYTFHILEQKAGFVMALDNILALFMLPLFGSLSDKTKTRWGRRMPYIVLGSFTSCAAMMLIPVANGMASLPLFIAGLALTLFCMSTFRSPAVALMPDVTIKPLRSKANAIINLMGTVGGAIILLLTNILLPKEATGASAYEADYIPVFLCCMVVMAIATILLMVFVNEPKLSAKMEADSKALGIDADGDAADAATGEGEGGDAARPNALAPEMRRSMGFLLASVALWFMGYNAVTTGFSRYFVEKFGLGAGGSSLILMVATVSAVISYLPVGILATKIGRKKVIMGGIVLLAASFAIGATLSSFSPVLYLMFVVAGVSWASINVNSYPMVVEMAKFSIIGKFTGYYYTASMAAQIATPIISGTLLENVGYWTLFPYVAMFVALSFVTMLFVRHGDAKPLPPQGVEVYDE